MEPFIKEDTNKEDNTTEEHEPEEDVNTAVDTKKDATVELDSETREETNNNQEDALENNEEGYVADTSDNDRAFHCKICRRDFPSGTRRTICPLVKDAFDKGRVCVVCGEGRESGRDVYGLERYTEHSSFRNCQSDEVHCDHLCSDWVRCEVCEDKVGQEFCDSVCRNAGTCIFPHHCQHKCQFITRMFTPVSLIFLVLGLVLYLWDVISDLILAVEYFNQGDVIWGSLTLSFFVVAGICMSVLNVHQWTYLKTQQSENNDVGKFFRENFPVKLLDIGFVMSMLLSVTPLMWVVVLIFVWRKGRKYLTGNEDRLRDTDLLQEKIAIKVANSQMVEAFIEAAPQFLLQLYIVFSSPWQGMTWKFGLQVFGISSAMISLSWTLVVLYCSFHLFDSKHPSNMKEKVCVLLWQLFVVIPRFLALALFASVYKWYILTIFLGHTGIVFISHFKVTVAKNCKAAVNSLLVATISNFGFNPKLTFFGQDDEAPPGCRVKVWYCLYHILVFMENALMIYLWFYKFSTSFGLEPGSNVGNNTTSLWPNTTEFMNTTKPFMREADAHVVPYWLGVSALVFVFISYFVAYCFRYIHRRFVLKERARFCY